MTTPIATFAPVGKPGDESRVGIGVEIRVEDEEAVVREEVLDDFLDIEFIVIMCIILENSDLPGGRGTQERG